MSSPFTELANYIYANPEKYAEYGRLLSKKEALMRLKLEGAKWLAKGEEPIFEDGSTLHEILIEFLEKDIIVVFEKDGELYIARVTLLVDPILDEMICKKLAEMEVEK